MHWTPAGGAGIGYSSHLKGLCTPPYKESLLWQHGDSRGGCLRRPATNIIVCMAENSRNTHPLEKRILQKKTAVWRMADAEVSSDLGSSSDLRRTGVGPGDRNPFCFGEILVTLF